MSEGPQVAVIGAGPAGMAAASAAAQFGVEIVVIDGYSQPGGQYFKQLATGFARHGTTSHQESAERMFRELDQGSIRLIPNTTVWGIQPSAEGKRWQLALHGPEVPLYLEADAVVLATGAYDRPVPFPGWTLPGVITAGAGQTMLKHQRVLPGHRVLLSGSGPLQLAVAAQMVRAGADVVAVLEGTRPSIQNARHLLAMWGQWERIREAWDYWRTLRQAHVEYRLAWSVVEARGSNRVEEAVIAPLDADWRPIRDKQQTVAVDALLIGYGFVSSTALARLLGCDLQFLPHQGGHVPRRDQRMRTSVPGVYAVGDGAGIGGAELSRIEGYIAGIDVAWQLGHTSADQAHDAIETWRDKLAHEQRFARMLGEVFAPGPGLSDLVSDTTTICRCENVTCGEISDAILAGWSTVTSVKRITRAGMGLCQGRICGPLVARLITQKMSRDPATVAPDSVRPPVSPIPVSILEETAHAR